MKRFWLLLPVVALLLAACSTAPLKEAYTASGDGTKPSELKKTRTFTFNDDLNVVVTLNAHNRKLPVYAIFHAPNGVPYQTDPIDADTTVGQLVLGLDWESLGVTSWPAGQWSVDLFIEDQRAATLHFSVEGAAALPNG